MKQVYFFVNLESDYDFRENFFVSENAFLYGFLIAIAAGVFVALAYYFGCCNSRTSNNLATMTNWIIALILAGAITYLSADFGIVGKKDGRFIQSNELYYDENYGNDENLSQDQLQEVLDEKTEIENGILEGTEQTTLPFALGSAVYSMLFFLFASLGVKGQTRHGISIPCKWPN